jgi:TonB-linked SusC/RagA family outer membrane protein
LGVSNPLATINSFEAAARNYQFISSLRLELTLSDPLSVISLLGLNYHTEKEELFMPNHGMELYYNDEAYNVAKLGNNDLLSLYNNTYLNYHQQFGINHQVRSSTGMNLLTNRFQYDWGLTKNAHENDEYRRLNNGTNILREMGGRSKDWNWLSFYQFLAYTYRDKYLVNVTVSLDGSSRIGKNADHTLKIGDQPLGLFYSAAVGWRISNEPFLRDISWLEELKLRLSYGKVGNDDVGETNSLNWYQAQRYRQAVGLYPAVLYNDRLTYESVNQVNAGLDLAFLGSRFNASFDLFMSETSDLLVYAPVSSYLGKEYRPLNSGRMENQGWDAAVFLRILDGSSFHWDIRANLSGVLNEITEIEGGMLVTPIEGGEIVNMVGEKANSFYGYIFEGVYSTTEEADLAGLVNDKDQPYGAGDAIYRDISGPSGEPDGVINFHDKTVIGSSQPDYTAGLMNSFRFKRWELGVLVNFITGHEVFNYLRYLNERMTGLENQSVYVLNRWQIEGQDTDVPKAAWNDPMGNTSFSTRWLEDGTYARLSNVYLSYTIPEEFLVFRNAEFYVSAHNLFTFSNYLGYDPEFAYSFLQVNQGIDYGLAPRTRQVIIGARIGF